MPPDGFTLQLDLLPAQRGRRAADAGTRRRPQHIEHALQIDCANMFPRILLPDVCWTSIDHAHSLNQKLGRNGKPIGEGEAWKRKARGIKAGICDVLFWHQGRGFAIELKTVDGVLSDNQSIWIKAMIRAGCEVSICWTIWQVFDRILAWGLCRPGVRVMT